MGNTFSDIGHQKAVSELELEMNSNTVEIHSPLKPLSLKIPTHVLQSLDFLSEMMGMTRSGLILNILDNYIGQATYDYLDGYNGFLTHEKPIEIVVSEDLDERLENSDLSDSAKQYLKNSLYHVAFEM